MSGASSQEIGALRVAEWRAEAALTGKTFAQVACAAMKAIIQPGGKPAQDEAAEVWAWDLTPDMRLEALAHATDRHLHDSSDRIRWDQLTDQEKLKVGVYVRGLHRRTARGWALR